MIRVLIISALMVSAVIADHDSDALEKIHNECIAETGLTAEDIPKLKTPSFYEESQDARCLIKCMAVKMGYMDESGNTNEEKVKEDIKKFNLDEAKVNKCEDEFKNEADLCMKMYRLHKCIMGDKIFEDE